MTQVVDLGIQAFRQIRPGAQCLLSRATATLMLGDNIRGICSTPRRAVNLDYAWITLKRELCVDLYIETHLDHSTTIPNFVEEAVKTIQNSPICHGSCLQVSRISHDYHSSADIIRLHVSFILCEEPHRLPRSLPGKLPRRVRGCAVDPHPPPGIDRATLSHIEIHMKSPKYCTPWSIFLTKLWLKDVSNTQLLESCDEDETNSMENTNIISLRPAHLSPSSSLGRPCDNLHIPIEDTRDLITQDVLPCRSSDNYLRDSGSGLLERSRNLNELLSSSILCLLSKPSRLPNDGVDSTTIEEGPRLSDIAPVLFRPGYYENVQHRAGLVPVVTKSIAMFFRGPLNTKFRQNIASVESNLNSRYKDSVNVANTNRRSDFRSLARCVVWTALQKGAYKVEQPARTIIQSSLICSNDDVCLFTEGSECDYTYGEDMLSSTIDSVTGGDDILSDADNGNEQDSGYYSIHSVKWIINSISGLDSLSDAGQDYILATDEPELEDSQSGLVTPTNSDGGEIIFCSSSMISPATSDMVMENDLASEALFLSESTSQDNARGDENDEGIIDDSSSMSILASSTNQHALEDMY